VETQTIAAPDRALPPDVARRVWVVVAAYNEERRLGETLRGLCAVCPNVVVVDDGSSDGTERVALAHSVWVLRHVVNCGQGAALQTGIDFALRQGAEVVVTFDADGQHAADEQWGKAGGRLVEHQEAWAAHQALRDGEHLLLSAAQRAAAVMSLGGDLGK